MLTIWIENSLGEKIPIHIHDPQMVAVLLNLLEKEESIPKMAKVFRDAGLLKEKG